MRSFALLAAVHLFFMATGCYAVVPPAVGAADGGTDGRRTPCRMSGAIAESADGSSCCGGHAATDGTQRCCNGGIGSPCASDLDCCGFYNSPMVMCILEGRGAAQGRCCVVSSACDPICD